MLLKLAGVTFATDRNPELKQLRPSGAVTFEAEPDNEHDENAVKVLYQGNHIGYVPKSEVAQKECLSHGTGRIVDYAYYDSDIRFNQKHIGQFQAMTFEVGDVEIDNGRIIGGNYVRATKFLSFFNPSGSFEGIIRWAFNQGDTYEKYEEALNEAAENGTLMHDAIESYLRKEDYNEEHLPEGWDNFVKNFEPEFVWGEERFYDNDLMVTGQPDFAGYIVHKGQRKRVLLDWKSSKRPSLKHAMQISLYSMNSQVDDENIEGAMVVAFGGDTKQGFSTKWISREQIESNYMACKHIKSAMECVGVYINEYY